MKIVGNGHAKFILKLPIGCPYLIYQKNRKLLFKKVVKVLYLVDRSKTKLYWWSPDAKYAMIFNSKEAAEAQAAKYKYGKFKVIKIEL